MQQPADDPVRTILGIYRQHGHRHYGEDVTELQHALQSATLAQAANEPESLVVAALLHDFGHLLHHEGEDVASLGVDMAHERLGAERLAGWYGPEIVEPIGFHVAAKRYLCWANPNYLAGLSEASRLSLQLQGGPMTDEEAEHFQGETHFEAAIRLRRYDDLGKQPAMRTPTLDDFAELLRRQLRAS